MQQGSWMKKLVSMDEALGRISSGDTVVVGMAAAQPQGFLSSLHGIRDRVHDVKVVSCLLLKEYPFLADVRADADSPFRMESWYFGNSERELYKKGLCSFIPNNLHNAGPVSYTHLRAHETVLDLVCRLLLEKKKKK